jgi:hypothetical protein
MNENVLLCGVVKDVGKSIVNNINMALETMRLFQKAKLIVYENNSKDNTKELLQEFAKKDCNNIVIMSQDIDDETIKKNSQIWAYTEITGSNHPCRIEQICNARNKIIEEINKSEYDEYTYVIWIDLDSHGWDIHGIADSFLQREKVSWDVVCANGIENGKKYYDLYALRMDNHLYGPEIIGEIFWSHLGKTQMTLSLQKEEWVPVYSAFGGIAIYKKELFRNNKYDCQVNQDVMEFYKNRFSTSMLYDPFTSPCDKFPTGFLDEETGIFWKSNSGYNKPVVCEHVCLHFALINKGCRIFINPKMVYYR